jgi:endogenous inhibitor of DNA gyrase (YacG/DUF329 family)
MNCANCGKPADPIFSEDDYFFCCYHCMIEFSELLNDHTAVPLQS